MTSNLKCQKQPRKTPSDPTEGFILRLLASQLMYPMVDGSMVSLDANHQPWNIVGSTGVGIGESVNQEWFFRVKIHQQRIRNPEVYGIYGGQN